MKYNKCENSQKISKIRLKNREFDKYMQNLNVIFSSLNHFL